MIKINSALKVRCEPGWSLATSWSQNLIDQDLWYVRAGRGRMRLHDGHQVPLHSGVAIWARPGGLYIAEQDIKHRLSVIAIHFDQQRKPPAEEVYCFRDADYATAVLSHVADLFMANQRDAATSLFEVLLKELTSGICTEPTSPAGTELHHQQTIDATAAQIRESPHDAPTIAELARRAGYSVSHFSRLFHERTGQSPRDFLVDRRIERARQLLRETPMTISQIADVMGYSSVFFFSRQFKQRLGVSPATYRKPKHGA